MLCRAQGLALGIAPAPTIPDGDPDVPAGMATTRTSAAPTHAPASPRPATAAGATQAHARIGCGGAAPTTTAVARTAGRKALHSRGAASGATRTMATGRVDRAGPRTLTERTTAPEPALERGTRDGDGRSRSGCAIGYRLRHGGHRCCEHGQARCACWLWRPCWEAAQGWDSSPPGIRWAPKVDWRAGRHHCSKSTLVLARRRPTFTPGRPIRLRRRQRPPPPRRHPPRRSAPSSSRLLCRLAQRNVPSPRRHCRR
jgi:hypothetical protein